MSTTMTHLTGAGPLGPLAHMDVPLGLGSSLWALNTIGSSTSDHNYCQTRMSYDYFITTTLGKQHSNTNTKFYSLVPPAPTS